MISIKRLFEEATSYPPVKFTEHIGLYGAWNMEEKLRNQGEVDYFDEWATGPDDGEMGGMTRIGDDPRVHSYIDATHEWDLFDDPSQATEETIFISVGNDIFFLNAKSHAAKSLVRQSPPASESEFLDSEYGEEEYGTSVALKGPDVLWGWKTPLEDMKNILDGGFSHKG